jgi:potassium channel subfamily K, other eukaryote
MRGVFQLSRWIFSQLTFFPMDEDNESIGSWGLSDPQVSRIRDATATMPPLRRRAGSAASLGFGGVSMLEEALSKVKFEIPKTHSVIPASNAATLHRGEKARFLASRLLHRRPSEVKPVSETLDRFFECFAAHHAIIDPISGRFRLSREEHAHISALFHHLMSKFPNGMIPVDELEAETLCSRWAFSSHNAVSESVCQRIIHLAQVSAQDGFVDGELFLRTTLKVETPRWLHRLKHASYKLLAIVLYYILGMWFYIAIENFSFIDAIYFITVSISTVGYGDIVPTTDFSRMITVFYVGIGLVLVVGVITGEITAVLNSYEERVKEVGKGVLEIANPEKRQKKIIALYTIHILFTIIIVAVPILGGMVVMFFTAPDSEGMSLMTSFYWAAMTSFSIGYGDFTPDGEWNKLWVTFFIFTGVACVSVAITQIVTLTMTIKLYKRMDLLRDDRLAVSLVAQLDPAKDGRGVDKFEFLAAMLVALEKVSASEIADILALFDKLDEERTGKVSLREILAKKQTGGLAEVVSVNSSSV